MKKIAHLPLTRSFSLAIAVALPASIATPPLPAQASAIQQTAPKVIKLKKPKQWTNLSSFAFSNDGQHLVGGMGTFTFNGHVTGGDVVLWTTKNGKLKKTMKGHETAVTAVAFSKDGKQVVSFSSASGEVRVFDAKRGKERRKFQAPTIDPQWTSVKPMLSGDGASLAHFAQEELDVAGKKKRITGALEIWDVATGKVRWRRDRTYAETASLSADGSLIAYYAQELNFKVIDGKAHYSSPNSVVRVLDMSDGTLLQTLAVGYMPIGGLAFSRDNKSVVAVNETLRRYSVHDGKMIGKKVETGAFGGLNWVQISSDDQQAAYNGELSNKVSMFDLSTTPPTPFAPTVVDGLQPPMLFSPDFRLLACELEGMPALLHYKKKR